MGSGLPVLLRYDLVGGNTRSGGLSRGLNTVLDVMAFLYSLGLTPQRCLP